MAKSLGALGVAGGGLGVAAFAPMPVVVFGTLALLVLGTLAVVVLTAALSKDPIQQPNATKMVDMLLGACTRLSNPNAPGSAASDASRPLPPAVPTAPEQTPRRRKGATGRAAP